MADSYVEVWRGSLVESRHRVSVAVVDARGRLRAQTGDRELVAFARSAVKPLQALPIIEDGAAERFDLDSVDIALCCASHSGEPRHVEGVRGLLRKIGADEAALACGVQVPLGKNAARTLTETRTAPTRLHNNCSGKHAGMLALARAHGWPLAGYQSAEHPVQQRMQSEMARWAQIPADELVPAVDGCGVITFALPLHKMAGAFAALASAARKGDEAPNRVVQAMVRNPEYIGGSERLCTELMRTTGGRIFVKVGAEGVYCAGVPGAELGIALKVEDGATRAAEPALIAVLKALALLTDEEIGRLERFAEPDLLNTREERVGVIRAALRLEAA